MIFILSSRVFLIITTLFLNSFDDITAPIVPENRAANRSLDTEPPPGQRCWGRNQKGKNYKCCTAESPCEEGEGDCSDDTGHTDCAGTLLCGNNNCKQFGQYYHEKDDCCEQDPKFRIEPPPGQRCAGSEYNGGNGGSRPGKRCCTPTNPCDEGEGDCDGFEDGGGGDGDYGCKGDLVCGSNNCRKKFGLYYHEKDDCCEKKENIVSTVRPNLPGLPLEPPEGQKCKGRNYGGRDCCTVSEPCGLGEGDCAPRDEGTHNDNRDCKGDLVCGSNNCRKFGLYYHEKDDCCDEPISRQQDKIKCFLFGICGETTSSTTEDPLFGDYDNGNIELDI